MTVKLNHYWTINPMKTDDYASFVLKDFIPGINLLGMHTVAGWSVMVGEYSEIVFETVANDLELLEKAMRDPNYQKLKRELLKHIKGYKTKVLIQTDKLKSYSTDVHENTVKFNQSWDVVAEKQADYDRFTTDEFYPALNDLGIFVASEWEVLIGDAPRIICEGRTTDIQNMISNLQSKKCRQLVTELKNYVENYRSRILSFHIQKVKGYKSASYKIVSN